MDTDIPRAMLLAWLKYNIKGLKLSHQLQCHQHVDLPIHESSVVLTTFLRECAVLMGRTTAIFKLGLHFDLNSTPGKFCESTVATLQQ